MSHYERNVNSRRTGMVAALALTVALAAAAVSSGVPDAAGDERAGHRPDWAGTVLRDSVLPASEPLPPGTTTHRVRYLSTDTNGLPIEVSGLVLVPAGDPPRAGRPVLSWGHGTTGIGDRCAPSADDTFGGYDRVLSAFLDAGFAIAATDYPGLGTPGDHPYLVAESEARSMIDAVAAARRVDPTLASRWFAVGHSQGGQAAMATAEWHDSYDPGLDFGGAVGFAPAPNWTDSVDQLGELVPVEQAFYAMTLVGLHAEFPRLRYADYLGPAARALLPDVESLCVNDLIVRFEQAALPGTEFVPRNAAATKRLRGWFADTGIGSRPAAGPLLVAQGDADQIVPRELTDAFVAQATAHGSVVRYEVYPGADHDGVLSASRRDVLAWLAENGG